ncbi:Protein kinase superfamily protein [Striga hermonthica]|uniref:Protein kinase superfamily protein n=1 Tax=Striga hermonthica TaxID=68872 RepID=A0A9N7ND89_STRHE|nr:Protein kinase superfamily protein [Striga hermonthica]
MGCVSSKKARAQSPAYDVVVTSGRIRSSRSGRLAASGPMHVGPLEKIREEPEKGVDLEGGKKGEAVEEDGGGESGNGAKRLDLDGGSEDSRAGPAVSQRNASFGFKFGRLAEAEQVAAGWPAWLTAVAGEAIDGWVPLRSDMYERLEKIGQGTYSTVYRARDLKTGKMVAVKKVRFDNFQPDSVRFMAREISILRRLDHPNVMKLQGIITSRLSCSINLVFEYMEHDLAGLLSCPDVKFTESQIKCYMRQLLSAIEHCHSRGIMHRDIKSSNILVNNEGILKVADFGLANFMRPNKSNKQPLTSRVVTLWYRPPELLMGSTNYGESVDLWSVGCVFAELFIGRPLLKGRTEVEQLHKIFKLCGSPPDDYWKKCRLPLATMFKPQQPYESTLRERCKEFPKSAIGLIETFLSVEPYKRGSASSSLKSEYFHTKPYACDPSSLPKYPPLKEIDAKIREDARRKKAGPRAEAGLRNPRRVRRASQESSNEFLHEADGNGQLARRAQVGPTKLHRRKSGLEPKTAQKQPYDTKSEASQTTQMSHGSSIKSVPVQVSASSGFAWAKRSKQHDVFTRPISRGPKPYLADPSSILHVNDVLGSDGQETDESSGRAYVLEPGKRAHIQRADTFDSHDVYESPELPEVYGNKKKGRVAFSGPITYESQEITSRQYEQARQVHRRSRFYKD